MPPLCEERTVEGNFKWGNKRGIGVKNKDTQFYESFFYDGVEYFLYDSVCFYHTNHVETSIGKPVKMYETSGGAKVIKIVWFLRPSEIRNFLATYRPSWNELFLGCGKSTGVSNLNLLESIIIGKCSVVCTSEDKRNPKPSEKELKRADFFFKCTFDVDRHVIEDKFADKIDGIEVEKFFNRKCHKKTSNSLNLETYKPPKAIKIKEGKSENVKDEVKTKTAPSDILRRKVKFKDKVETFDNISRKIMMRTSKNFKDEVKEEVKTYKNVPQKRLLDSYQVKRRKIIGEKEEFDEKEEPGQDESVKLKRKVTEVTERPNAEKRKWFKQMPWEGRLQKAQELDRLVLLTNLDPSYTSYEVEDLVWHALKEKVEARMIELSPDSNTYYGTALVIFRTKDAAENAISELNRRCLILENGRVVGAEKGTLRDPIKQNTFIGHQSLSRAARHKQCREMRNAVSTSHCSQPNTIEYAMAIEWTMLQDQSEACWKALSEEQMKEINDVQSKLRKDRIFLEDS